MGDPEEKSYKMWIHGLMQGGPLWVASLRVHDVRTEKKMFVNLWIRVHLQMKNEGSTLLLLQLVTYQVFKSQ